MDWLEWKIGAALTVATLVAAGCPAEDEDDGGEATEGSPTGASETESGSEDAGTVTGSAGTSGDTGDPEVFCAQFTEPGDCQYSDEATDVHCEWVTATAAALEDGACSLGDPIGACLAVTGATTAAGCAPSPGCDGEPFFREVEGEIRVSMQCGGSPPVGYEPCTYVEPGVFEPAECGCLCDEAVDNTGGGSGDGG